MADFQSSGTLELFIEILKSLIKYGIIASPPNFKISDILVDISDGQLQNKNQTRYHLAAALQLM
jgi:hypothetical protein